MNLDILEAYGAECERRETLEILCIWDREGVCIVGRTGCGRGPFSVGVPCVAKPANAARTGKLTEQKNRWHDCERIQQVTKKWHNEDPAKKDVKSVADETINEQCAGCFAKTIDSHLIQILSRHEEIMENLDLPDTLTAVKLTWD